MEELNLSELYSIASDVGINSDLQLECVSNNINSLNQNYSSGKLVQIYNHFLSIETRQDVLMVLIRCIDKFRDKSSIDFVLDKLLDKNNSTNLRSMAAKVLANFKDTRVVTPLLYCLNDKNEPYQVRLACADSLGRVGDKFAVAPLIDIVQDEDEKSVYVRESAAVALGLLGDFRAIDPLVSILETKKGFLDKFTFLKERVIEALGKFNFSNAKVIKALSHSLVDDSPSIRINSIEALMNIDNDEARELIETKLFDEEPEVKKNALIALYNILGKDILDKIIQNSQDYDDFLVNEAQNMILEYENESEEDD